MAREGSGFGIRVSGFRPGPYGLVVPVSLGFLLTLSPSTSAADSLNGRQEHVLGITVRVYNYAQASPGTLERAQIEAARVLGEVGIEAQWISCPLIAAEAERNPVCRQNLSPTDLVLRIQPRFQAANASSRHATLGFAPLSEGERGSYASVFYDRVMSLAAGGDFHPALILGHAAAHEIGHLLLRTMTHSSTGLMRALWGREDLQRARVGHLLFAPQQAQLMRGEVLLRQSEIQPLAGLATLK